MVQCLAHCNYCGMGSSTVLPMIRRNSNTVHCLQLIKSNQLQSTEASSSWVHSKLRPAELQSTSPIHLCPSPITATPPPPPADSQVPCSTMRASVHFSLSRALPPFHCVVHVLPRTSSIHIGIIIVVVFFTRRTLRLENLSPSLSLSLKTTPFSKDKPSL